jgi:hypothetical protein
MFRDGSLAVGHTSLPCSPWCPRGSAPRVLADDSQPGPRQTLSRWLAIKINDEQEDVDRWFAEGLPSSVALGARAMSLFSIRIDVAILLTRRCRSRASRSDGTDQIHAHSESRSSWCGPTAVPGGLSCIPTKCAALTHAKEMAVHLSTAVCDRFITFIMKSLLFLAGNFSIVPFGPLSMRIWWPFEKNRTCAPFFGSGYAGLGKTTRTKRRNEAHRSETEHFI